MADGEHALELTTSEADDAVVIAVAGELDPHTAPDLEGMIDARSTAGATIVLDLGDLRFIDSSGLRVIIAAHKALEERGGRLVIRRPTETAVRLLAITGLDEVLHVE